MNHDQINCTNTSISSCPFISTTKIKCFPHMHLLYPSKLVLYHHLSTLTLLLSTAVTLPLPLTSAVPVAPGTSEGSTVIVGFSTAEVVVVVVLFGPGDGVHSGLPAASHPMTF